MNVMCTHTHTCACTHTHANTHTKYKHAQDLQKKQEGRSYLWVEQEEVWHWYKRPHERNCNGGVNKGQRQEGM